MSQRTLATPWEWADTADSLSGRVNGAQNRRAHSVENTYRKAKSVLMSRPVYLCIAPGLKREIKGIEIVRVLFGVYKKLNSTGLSKSEYRHFMEFMSYVGGGRGEAAFLSWRKLYRLRQIGRAAP